MIDEAQAVVRAGAPEGRLLTRRRQAFMRYHGQGHEIEIPLPDRALEESDIAALRSAFEEEYSRQFSRAVPGMTIEILNWAVSSIVGAARAGALPRDPNVRQPARTERATPHPVRCHRQHGARRTSMTATALETRRSALNGPALIVEPQTTTFVSADFSAQCRRRRQYLAYTQPERTDHEHDRHPPAGHVEPASGRGRGTGAGADPCRVFAHRARMRGYLGRDL